ncbi:uncharacterized protein METZ01_LOCUS202104, partial [marine metagenome]
KAEDLYKNYKWGYQIPAELYINKARLLLRLRLYDEAERSINDYLTIVKIPFILLEQDDHGYRIPGSGPGYFILANIYSATGRLEKALYKYSQVGGKSELKAEAHNNRALIFIKKKSFKQAFEELNQAIIISPNLVDAHYNLGNLLIKTNGDSIKARKHLEKALKLITSQERANRIKSLLKTLP